MSIILLIIAGIFLLAMLETAKRTAAASEASALILAIVYLEARERAKRHD